MVNGVFLRFSEDGIFSLICVCVLFVFNIRIINEMIDFRKKFKYIFISLVFGFKYVYYMWMKIFLNF